MEFFCSSTSSLAGSSSPPNRAYPWIARSDPASAMAVNNDDPSEDESSIEIAVIGRICIEVTSH